MKNFAFWVKICVFNFFIVSLLGVAMRYKMAFSLPGFSHKFMQESHSHFAFYGWVSAAIYLFVTKYLAENGANISLKKYRFMMIFNQIGSYGMLFSFLYSGYFWLSIAFSSVAMSACFAYALFLWKDSKKIKNSETIWLNAGAFFAIFSSIGIFGLAYFSNKKVEFGALYRASMYFYLHFQYNGFFLFSCIGLLLISLKKYAKEIPKKLNKTIFALLFTCTFFSYGLSVLWLEMNIFLRGFFILISLIQLFAAIQFLLWVKKTDFFGSQNSIEKTLLSVVGFAFLSKFILQSLSAIPALRNLAFNNIHVVIAYLHLVLLVGISLFLIWKIIGSPEISPTKNLNRNITLMTFGMLLNEIILILLPVFSFFYISFPFAKYGLLFASLIIMVSLILFLKELKIKYQTEIAK